MADDRAEKSEPENEPADLLAREAMRLDDLLGYARAHAETGDTREWIDDLERMLAVAWELMTADQKLQFTEHADIAALIEAAGGSAASL